MIKITWIGNSEDEVRSSANILSYILSGYGGKQSLTVPSIDIQESPSTAVYHTLIDDKPIKYSASPELSDFYFVFEESILGKIRFQLHESGILVVNTAVSGYQYGKHLRTHSINATAIAEALTGGSSVTAAFIGTLTALSGLLSYNTAVSGISALFGENAEKNIALFAVSYGIILEGASL